MTVSDLASPRIDRLLAALNHQKLDRVPNLEAVVNNRTISHLLGPRSEGSSWSLPEAAR